MKSIPKEWLKQRDDFKLQWIAEGCEKSFYEWLLEKFEEGMQNK